MRSVWLAGVVLGLSVMAGGQEAPHPSTMEPSKNGVPGAVADGVAAVMGPFEARSFNFVTRRWETYPLHAPFVFRITDSTRVQGNDLYDGVDIVRTILSGTENYVAPKDGSLRCGPQDDGCDRFENLNALQLELRAHSPVQIGGAMNEEIDNYSPGDSIALTMVNRYTGYSRGTDEATRMMRLLSYPEMRRWGGRILTLQAGPATREKPQGNVAVTVARCEGCSLEATAEGGAPVIDVTRARPVGNAERVQMYAADRRFAEVTLDGAGEWPVSHVTTLTRAVDRRADLTACGGPGQAAAWAKADAFTADERGEGNRSALTCFAVSSTDGMEAGMVVVIGGDRSNLEMTRVITRVDGTHFVANARMPHAGPGLNGAQGEMVAWGGYAGWAGGFTADVEAPQGMSEAERGRRGWAATACFVGECNRVPLYLTPVVMASLPGRRLLVYLDTEATSTALNTLGLMANAPVRTGAMKAEVAGGRVRSVTVTDGGNYNERLPEEQGLRINSGQMRLPPPTVTVAGCRVKPVIRTEIGDGGALRAEVVDGGSGCPADAAVTVQREWENPFVVYPAALVYRAIRPGEQREMLDEATGYQVWMPPAGEFRVGDEVLQTTWALQQVGDVAAYERDWGFNSARFGPVNDWQFRGQGQGQALIKVTNADDPYRFYSDAAHGWAPTRDGGGYTAAPNGMTFAGAFGNVFNVWTEPRMDVTGSPGSFVSFGCPAQQIGVPCQKGKLGAFRLFTVGQELGGAKTGGEESFAIDPVGRRWTMTVGGAGAVIATDARLEVAGCKGCSLAGETEAIGGGRLEAGACATGETNVTGAEVGTPVLVSASDGSLPGGRVRVDAAVNSAGRVRVEVCAVTAGEVAAKRYRVRVMP